MKKILSLILSAFVLLTFNAFALGDAEQMQPLNDGEFEAITHESVFVFPDGGKDYTYNIGGVENHLLVPPDGFDPLNATDGELARYCFPPRPDTMSDEYTTWESRMANYSGTPEPVIETKTIPVSTRKMTPSVSRAAASNSTSWLWSGYASDLGNSSTTYYNQAQMDFTQPSISAITNNACSNLYWVGFGGFLDSAKLVQAGTATNGKTDHYAWYEYLSDTGGSVGIQRINSLTINAGDDIHVYISFQRANNKFEYYIANDTTGQSVSAYVSLSASDYYDGTTVEWVVERPMWFNPMDLGNYGTVILSNCKATKNTSNTWLNLDSLSGLYKITMTRYNNTPVSPSNPELSTPGSISSSNKFTCTWHGFS